MTGEQTTKDALARPDLWIRVAHGGGALAQCRTCHWSGPVRPGRYEGAQLAEADAAAHRCAPMPEPEAGGAVDVVLSPPPPCEPFECFVEIETADGRSVHVPSTTDAKGYRRVGPLYAIAPGADAASAFARWWKGNEMEWSWHLDTRSDSKAQEAFEAGFRAALAAVEPVA